MVGTTGFEPATSSTPRKRATGLRHVPIIHESLQEASLRRVAQPLMLASEFSIVNKSSRSRLITRNASRACGVNDCPGGVTGSGDATGGSGDNAMGDG